MAENNRNNGVLWLIIYVLFALFPLLFLFVGATPEREPWRWASLFLAFIGIGLMAVHFPMTAHIAASDPPFDRPAVYRAHHQIAYVTTAAWLGHILILVVRHEWARRLLNVFTASWHARWATIATVALLVLMVLSIWRGSFGLKRVAWRNIHSALSVVAFVLAMVHAYMVGNFLGTSWERALWIVYGVITLLMIVYLRVYKPYLKNRTSEA